MLISESALNHEPPLTFVFTFLNTFVSRSLSSAAVRTGPPSAWPRSALPRWGMMMGLTMTRSQASALSLTASDRCFSSVRAAAVRGQTATVLHLSRGQGDYKVGEQLLVEKWWCLWNFPPSSPLFQCCVCAHSKHPTSFFRTQFISRIIPAVQEILG